MSTIKHKRKISLITLKFIQSWAKRQSSVLLARAVNAYTNDVFNNIQCDAIDVSIHVMYIK